MNKQEIKEAVQALYNVATAKQIQRYEELGKKIAYKKAFAIEYWAPTPITIQEVDIVEYVEEENEFGDPVTKPDGVSQAQFNKALTIIAKVALSATNVTVDQSRVNNKFLELFV